ncbi:hypothetical protein INT45_006818 [Circinella minor]|uniref:Uncharacterized protein n=1 Tax=Circinella minor TaxID=1195481 RepID=A0A8H7VA06_9FUNG|nr:hypothetical protein INT45_006818 [Circinella minor]
MTEAWILVKYTNGSNYHYYHQTYTSVKHVGWPQKILRKDFPTAGMDMLLARKYMSDEESDDEDPTTSPVSVLRPSYRSDNANRFLERLDELHFASGRIRRHQSTRMPRSVMLVERAVPEELPRWMKK